MALSGPPPPQNYAPISQYFGSVILGSWVFYAPPYLGWWWVGNGPVGWRGNPWAGYTYEAKPAMPAGWGVPAPAPAPAPGGTPGVPAPPPPAPGTGVPAETPPPKPITGDKDNPPQEGCGQPIAMAELVQQDKLNGKKGEDGLRSPTVANMFSLPVHTRTDWAETQDPNKYVAYNRQPKIVKDDQGRYQVVWNGTAAGVVVFSPPELFDHHAYGDGTLFNSKWPKVISRSSFLILSGADAGSDNDADNVLSFGLAYPTSALPKSGFYFSLSAGTLSLTPTGATAATDLTERRVNIGANVQALADIKVPAAANPNTGDYITTTLWANSGDTRPYWGANKLAYFSDIGAGTGDVVGPGSATDNAVALFDSTTGKLIKNSTLTYSSNLLQATAGALGVSAAAGSGTSLGRAANTSSVLGTAVNIGDLLAASAVQLSVVAGSTLAGPPQTTTLAGGGLVNSLEDDGTNGYREYIEEVQTTDTTVTTIIDIPRPSASATCLLEYRVTAVNTADTTKRMVQREVVEFYDNAGTLTLGTSIEGPNIANTFASGGTIAAAVSGTNLRVTVRGAAATTINWGIVAKVSWRNTTT